MKQYATRLRAFLLALSLLLPLAACAGSPTAATMHLRRTEGTVSVSDGSGKNLPTLDNLGLYSGYGVGTRPASYAWIDLDEVKLTKLDQNSEIAIRKDGKALSIELKSGSLFFNVTKPLEDDETMNISTSTMIVGIRGTCGWVSCRDDRSQVYLLEGKAECSAEGQTVRVSAGEMAELSGDGELAVREFTAGEVPAFVQNEVDPTLAGIADATPGPETPEPSESPETPEPSDTPEPSEPPEYSGQAGDDVTWSLYGDGTLIVSGTGPMTDFSRYSAPWYSQRSQIHTVIIDDGVTTIGNYAFEKCSITRVTIADSVAAIGAFAFDGCGQLTAVSLPDGVTAIGSFAFNECGGLRSVVIPGGVASIEMSAFHACTNLRSVVISHGVTSIAGSAFGWCGNLTDVTIPDSVSDIESYAFSGCGRLASVYYGGSEEQWEAVSIADNNDPLLNAVVYCNSTWIAAAADWNGHIYRVYDVSIPWEEAMAYCENLGGHLATITSREEQAVVNGLLGESCSKNGYWLGGVRTGSGFAWITGEQMSYTNWDSRQPDNEDNREDKLMLYNYSGDRLGKWNDLSSEGVSDVIVAHGDLGFICEWDLDEAASGAGAGQQQTSWQGHRYQVFNNVSAWLDAEAFCEQLGGHLATISSQEENDFIYQFIIDAGYTSAYFGLTDRYEEGTWIWVTGEPVTYTNWHTDEPNSEHPNENYGMFYNSFRDGTWNDGDFEWGQTGGGTAFICEWDPADAQPPSDQEDDPTPSDQEDAPPPSDQLE